MSFGSIMSLFFQCYHGKHTLKINMIKRGIRQAKRKHYDVCLKNRITVVIFYGIT